MDSSQGSSSQTSVLFDSPKSIFGFEPINGYTPSGQQLRTQRSLLAELLQASAEGHELAEEIEEVEDDCSTRLPIPTLRPNWCTCNVGQCVPREFHARDCAMTTEFSMTMPRRGAEHGAVTAPINIPTKTYYKSARQIEDRQRLIYQRQMYRMQLEAHEQAIAAGRA
ncbi:hypothetical protein VOLCADRAFT_85807 [Volvox carteri f. nagariensis]|uniref:Uncharacterized protein n=1 Tax=Volvox carteri f. nagariensis TaxID=3068 RepID=D8TH17_VOLCA|nr:uncharacterized protein VOLCADRAFT_85807 [Volvox carteri f. nagariensis]EFJ52994.1 hypothetical protein VOLCADRAFT_85807 [Volvox carteri f. nagariensis]|eukprot:XP_002945999.1 hypothetical protein VOLCADRAFT_85807 [Volvox carteri f. nagariensis]